MNKERMPNADKEQEDNQQNKTAAQPARSSAFNEESTRDQKQTINPEEEADLEQERKEAMTERD